MATTTNRFSQFAQRNKLIITQYCVEIILIFILLLAGQTSRTASLAVTSLITHLVCSISTTPFHPLFNLMAKSKDESGRNRISISMNFIVTGLIFGIALIASYFLAHEKNDMLFVASMMLILISAEAFTTRD